MLWRQRRTGLNGGAHSRLITATETEIETVCLRVPIGVQASMSPVRGQHFGCEKSFSLEPIVAQTSDQPTGGTAKGLPHQWNLLAGMGEAASLRRPIALRDAMFCFTRWVQLTTKQKVYNVISSRSKEVRNRIPVN